jgi:hypothetical protein
MQIYPHEAWCPRCRVSHPPGTKRCLHCGNGVLPVRPVEGMRSASTTFAPPGPIGIPTAPGPAEAGGEEAAAPPQRMTSLRLGLNAIWIALFVIVTAVRVCSERGG